MRREKEKKGKINNNQQFEKYSKSEKKKKEK